MLASRPNAPRWRLILSFAAIYFLWGGSFLAIRFSLETIPTFMISFARFACAGVILMTVAWRSGAPRPTWAQWRTAAILGFIMFFGANSTLVAGQRTVASGLAATLYATLPLWMAVLGWLWQGEDRPRGRVLVGLVLGFAGVVLMFGGGGSGIDPTGGLLVIASAIFWAVGSLLSRKVDKPQSSAMASGMNLFCSGLMFLIVSVFSGEPAQLHISMISLKSWLALLYLIVGSSVVAFSCYMWLLSVTSTSRVATYAYVNPVVALFIGALAGEVLDARELVAALVIVVAVALITSARSKTVAAESPIAEGGFSVRSRWKALRGIGRTSS
ncbi:MAG: EamA family transporter [Chloroflexi bacterium]|nr:EamA family transporter [Chloroflexota bacterium]MCC6896271.1 EamA family transporter [Anaerolineae bacterium]